MTSSQKQVVTNSSSSPGTTEIDRILAEMVELSKKGEFDDTARSHIEKRIDEAVQASQDEISRSIVGIKSHPDVSQKVVLSNRFRRPIGLLLLLVLGGSFLELTIGTSFIFSYGNEYRNVCQWIFWGSFPFFVFGWIKLDQSNRDFRSRFPTWWVRVFVVLPLMAMLCSLGIAISPLGWIAASGWLIGEEQVQLTARIQSIDERSPKSKNCKQSAQIELEGTETKICVEGLLTGVAPKAGDVIFLTGRVSKLGIFIQHVVAR